MLRRTVGRIHPLDRGLTCVARKRLVRLESLNAQGTLIDEKRRPVSATDEKLGEERRWQRSGPTI